MVCADCWHWTLKRVMLYGDGSEIVKYQAPDGKGFCEQLKIETAADFSCASFRKGSEHIEVLGKKSGAPWHHSVRGACPDCKGAGSSEAGICPRCCGCGNVNYYDDGFIGEEAYRLHPNEVKTKVHIPSPTCPTCSKDVQKEWVSCPFCGQRLIEPPSRVSGRGDILSGEQ